MPSPFGGETVEIIRFEADGYDGFGNPIKRELEPEPVTGVLVAIGGQSEPSENIRPDGVKVAYTLYFPKSFTGEVDNCECNVRGHRCRFVGHSDRWPSPNPWNMASEVENVEG